LHPKPTVLVKFERRQSMIGN